MIGRLCPARSGLPLLIVAATVLVVLIGPARAAAQPPDTNGAGRPDADTVADTALTTAPQMADAPRPFRVSATGGMLAWSSAEGAPDIDDGPLVGLEIERILFPFISARLGGGYGPTRFTSGDDRGTDAAQYIFDLVIEARLALDRLLDRGLVPFATVGVGSVVHDPADPALTTRSQNALAYGLGLEAELGSRFGGRAEYRRYAASLQPIFDPEDRSGRDRTAHRLLVSLFWRF